ncbi:hypothetical protein INT43_005516 [Umbelopsis isabellina]|uniref:RING-type domain-containing protein n=1 Tax=Mortierella isabellina TaxID=91625 RepID=A0A8H7PLM0_MORIS|nr:hypothetical protein INT43_005516 [Umbelopsis isabellina]
MHLEYSSVSLQKRASNNYRRDQTLPAEPYLTPRSWTNIDNTSDSLTLDAKLPSSSSSSSSHTGTISDSFWTANNNAMIAFFVVLGIFVFALGLWVGFMIFSWRKRILRNIDEEHGLQRGEQITEIYPSAFGTTLASQSSVKINQSLVDSICPSSKIEDPDNLTIGNLDSHFSSNEKVGLESEILQDISLHDVSAERKELLSKENFSQSTINVNQPPTGEWKEMCAICLEDYTPTDYYRKLPCGHTFHTDCVDKWFSNTRKIEQIACPTCKADLSKTFEAVMDTADAAADGNSILNVSIAASTIRFRRIKRWFRLVPEESEEDALRRISRRQMRARRLMAYRMQQAHLAADGGYAASMYAPYPTFAVAPFF